MKLLICIALLLFTSLYVGSGTMQRYGKSYAVLLNVCIHMMSVIEKTIRKTSKHSMTISLRSLQGTAILRNPFYATET